MRNNQPKELIRTNNYIKERKRIFENRIFNVPNNFDFKFDIKKPYIFLESIHKTK